MEINLRPSVKDGNVKKAFAQAADQDTGTHL